MSFAATTAHHLDIGALSPGSCGIVEAIDAIAAGKKAAISIDRYLRGEAVERKVRLPSTTPYMRPDRKLCWR